MQPVEPQATQLTGLTSQQLVTTAKGSKENTEQQLGVTGDTPPSTGCSFNHHASFELNSLLVVTENQSNYY